MARPEPFFVPEPDLEAITRFAAGLIAEPERLDGQVLRELATQPRRYTGLKHLLTGRGDHNLTVALQRLQNEGLVERSGDPNEKTVQVYQTTPYGLEVLRAVETMTLARNLTAQPTQRGGLSLTHNLRASDTKMGVGVLVCGVGSGKMEALVTRVRDDLANRQFDCNGLVWSTDESAKQRNSLFHQIDDHALTIFLWTSQRRADKRLDQLMAHFREHPKDSTRHCFLAHNGSSFTDLVVSAMKKGPDAPVVQFTMWDKDDQAVSAARRVVTLYTGAATPP